MGYEQIGLHIEDDFGGYTCVGCNPYLHYCTCIHSCSCSWRLDIGGPIVVVAGDLGIQAKFVVGVELVVEAV